MHRTGRHGVTRERTARTARTERPDHRQLDGLGTTSRTFTEIIVTSPKTQAARRLVDLDAYTIDVLRRERNEQQRAGLHDPLGWVFRREPGGGPLRPESVSAAFDRLVVRHDVPRIRLHDLRHTYATLAVHAGLHPMVLSDRLGHSNVATTIDMYVHVTPPTARHAANAVAERLFDPDES